MNRGTCKTYRLGLALVLTVCVGLTGVAAAAPEEVPRILLAGDSWSAFLHAYGSFHTVLPEYTGLEEYRSLGYKTSIVGVSSSGYNQPEILALVSEELAAYPTVDIVHLSLGGNSILYGDSWQPGMTPAQEQALYNQITGEIEDVIDYVLAIRPDIRIGLCGYTFVDHDRDGATVQEMNEALVGMEQAKLALTQSKERVYYIHHLGLMQYHYGVPDAEPPITPETLPYPGGYPAYTPMPGGTVAHNAPLEALVDNDIHLTQAGYTILARRCVDEFYEEWLSWPKAIEMVQLGAKGPEFTFQVTFTEAVAGVDETDFSVAADGGGKAPVVVSVDGSGAVYTVTVDLDGSAGTALLSLIDDDTIVDLDGVPANPLGGPGAGNGNFAYNGAFNYEEPPPPQDDDFDAALRFLDSATVPYADLLNGFSFAPENCDANGGFGGVDPVIINGNGLMDSYEFWIIRACLQDIALDLSETGGVTHEMVISAWANNLNQMQSDLGGEGSLASVLIPGMDTVLAGFMTLGDPVSSSLPILLVLAAQSVNEFPVDVEVPILTNYVLLPDLLGLDGDADGDGYTNQEEYDFFVPLGGKDLYVMAALDPLISPEESCQNHSGGSFRAGNSFCLAVPGPVDLSGGFQWKRDGVSLIDEGVLSGSQWRELHILSLRVEDAGAYTCEYNDNTKAPAVFGPIDVEVSDAVPAVGLGGLALLAGLMALAGVCWSRVSARCGIGGGGGSRPAG